MIRALTLILTILSVTGAAETKSARTAMLLCLVPGGGQFYTDRIVPGIAIAGAEITLGYFAYQYHRDGKYDQRNSMLWWGFFVFGYSLADAYVGAKMHDFSIETDLNKVSLGYHIRW